MNKGEIKKAYQDKGNTLVRFSPYAVAKTGLVSNQTILKIADYMLICSPYQISMNRCILLLILSAEESRFFQKYRRQTCTLSVTFRKSGRSNATIFELSAEIERIGPVKSRNNLCLIDLVFNKHPASLVELLSEYISEYEELKSYYSTFQGRVVTINQETSRSLRYNNFTECYLNHEKIAGSLLSLSSDQLVLTFPPGSPEVWEGSTFTAKLFFQLYQFTVQGTVKEIEGYGAGKNKVIYSIDFAPELIEILDDYFYRQDHERDGDTE